MDCDVERRERRERALADLSMLAISEMNLSSLLTAAAEAARHALQADFASVLELRDEAPFVVRAASGGDLGQWEEILASLDAGGAAAEALRLEVPVIVEHGKTQHGIRSSAAMVVRGRDGPFGVVSVHSCSPGAFGEGDRFFLRSVANVVAAAAARDRYETDLKQLAAIVETSFDVIFTRTVDGVVTSWNAAAERVLGYTADEIVGRNVDDLTPRELHGELTRTSERLRRGEYIPPFETVRLRKDGTPIDVALALSPITDSAGKVVSASAIMRDIRAEKEAKERLAVLAEQYRLLFQNNPTPIYVFDAETHRFLAVNDAAIEQYGYSRDEFLAMTIEQIRPEDELPRLREALRERGTAPSRGLVSTDPWRHHRKDGSIIEVDISSHSIEFEGRPARVVLAIDVTQRLRAERALRESEARYRELFEQANDLIAVTDLDQRLTSVNRAFAEALGYEPDELIGRRIVELVPARWHRELFEAARAKLANERTSTTYEHELIAKDGRTIVVEAATRLLEQDGAAFGIQAICRDVTARREAERALEEMSEQLRSAQRLEAIGRVAGGVAHDFNNLLTVITGYSEFALERDDRGEIREAVGEVLAAARSADALTAQLLAFSRQQVLQPEVLDVAATIAKAERLLHGLLGTAVDVRLVVAADVARISVDPTQFEQVLLNLAVNARDAMPDGGTLAIEAETVDVDEVQASTLLGLAPGRYVCVSVSDSGVGMEEETRKQVFEPFFTTKTSGTGLGLATVHGIVSQSGGHISVYSEPGGGTTFRMLFPAVDEEAETSAPDAAGLPERRGARTILVIDDEAPIRRLTARILAGEGHEVLSAATADEALEIAGGLNEGLDLIVSDVRLPGRSGPELTEQLRTLHPGAKSLLISGYAAGSLGNGGLDYRQPFLKKPFTAASLTAKVREILAA